MEKQKQKEAESAALIASASPDKVSESETIPNEDESEGSSEEEEAGPSNRLDPSLFAEVFARPVSAPRSILKKRSAEEEADEVAKLQKARRLQRQKQRAGGVVKGRDGMPMKRTSDGTVLRALNTSSNASANHKTSFDDDEAEPEEPLDSVSRPAPLDPSVSLPNAKARAFKKRTLAKKGTTKATASSKGSGAKPKKSEDDPLGLNDPAFCPAESSIIWSTRVTRPKAQNSLDSKRSLRHVKHIVAEAFAKTLCPLCVREVEADRRSDLRAASKTPTMIDRSRSSQPSSIPAIHCTCSFTRMVNLTHLSIECCIGCASARVTARQRWSYWRKAHMRSLLQHQHALGMKNVALDEALIDHAGHDGFDVL